MIKGLILVVLVLCLLIKIYAKGNNAAEFSKFMH
ncbi:hypothetical protein DI53_3136 [Sphingobacterium deserti]|uniref:Uncharacterized protein n=1 Tax=Sphingobacterium deserti TaxID=1229276 RepID=A0A0B8SZD8_9SPHI|nr:hypothetical protein DI53_3136 [Sphingobacterium deserti]